MLNNLPDKFVNYYVFQLRLHLFYVECCFVLFLVGFPNSLLAATEYHVEGKMTFFGLSGDRKEHSKFIPANAVEIFSFTINVKDCQWSIEYTPLLMPKPAFVFPNMPVVTNWSKKIAGDGKEFCNVYHDLTTNILFTAFRANGNPPFDLEQEAAILWYTYASHRVLHEKKEGAMTPMEIMATSPTKTVPTKWICFTNPPYLPQQVVSFGYFRYYDQNDTLTFLRLPNNDLSTNVFLSVEKTTNLDGLTIPVVTTVRYTSVRNVIPGTNSTIRIPFSIIRVEAERITSKSDVTVYPPPLKGAYSVLDCRSYDTNTRVSAVIATDAWPTLEKVRATTARELP